jgi:hypothetical protein
MYTAIEYLYVSDSVKTDCNVKHAQKPNNQQKDIGEANEYEGLVTLDPTGLLIEC